MDICSTIGAARRLFLPLAVCTILPVAGFALPRAPGLSVPKPPAKPGKKAASKPPPKAAKSPVPKPAAPTDPAPDMSTAPVSYAETLPDSVVKLQMVGMPAGTLTVGGKPTAVKPFWIANTETSWEAYDVFIASGTPSPAYDQTKFAVDAIARPSRSYILPDLGWGHHGFPAINISFLSATMFCRWLAATTGKKYRLPTEVEWEFACRAGGASSAPMTKAQAAQRSWYADNSDSKTQLIAKKLPNAWKLYDMLGNVGEWATDAKGEPVLCGPSFKEKLTELTPTIRKRWTPAWQAEDPQLPKSRWWLSNGNFVGFRVICEP
jgi:formylglycine-generating enzyme required for sulfatase activity